MSRRRISVVTGTRADYGIYRPVLERIQAHPELELAILVCGMHLSDKYGRTVADINADGFPIGAEIETLMPGDTPREIAQSMARGLEGFAAALASSRPDILLVLGDRYEMLAAASAALPFAIPLAHIHGGETTEGLIDEAIRHAITKMSHLHFASTAAYADRIVRMGEHPDRVYAVGAPGLDNLNSFAPLSGRELEALVGMTLDPAPLLVTFHPVTLDYGSTGAHIEALISALADAGRPIVFTYPNADTHGQLIIDAITKFVAGHPTARAVKSLGTKGYFSLMARAAAMVGNSSSGIVEAASFELPVVDIGIRQRGRIRGRNVLHADPDARSIASAIAQATAPQFRVGLAGMTNLYGDGTASGKIVDVLARRPLDAALVQKEFYDKSAA